MRSGNKINVILALAELFEWAWSSSFTVFFFFGIGALERKFSAM